MSIPRKSILKPQSKPKIKKKISKLTKQNISPSSKISLGINLSQNLTTKPTMMLRQECSYTESCIPQTIKIAEQSKNLLYSLIRYLPKVWSFADKVLVFLVPDFRADVRRYYLNDGQNMVNIFDSNQIEELDKLLAQNLTEVLNIVRQKNKKAAKFK